MLSIKNETVKELLLTGKVGLEKESLRVTGEGFLSHTRHPVSPDHKNITRDFCENQTEINTPALDTAEEAVASLNTYYKELQRVLAKQAAEDGVAPEYLWPFSNPPYIRNEEDVPVAVFTGDKTFKTHYRTYLSDKYGRYLMTFSGIHFNYSFSDELLWEGFQDSGLVGSQADEQAAFQDYKNRFYLELAKKAAAYGWLVVAVTAASPVVDRSFVEFGELGGAVFTGKASLRVSENGYWNFFTPVFDYRTLDSYTNSIQAYVSKGILAAPSELYYPVRLKPRGENNLETLRDHGVDHIELRMLDLNPLEPVGLNVKDVKFVQLLLAFLACTGDFYFPEQDQIQAVQNMKAAAHYDLEHTKIVLLGGHCCSVAEAGRIMLRQLQDFYRDAPEDIQEVLSFEARKFEDPSVRYATQVRALAGDSFVEAGLKLAKERQEEALV